MIRTVSPTQSAAKATPRAGSSMLIGIASESDDQIRSDRRRNDRKDDEVLRMYSMKAGFCGRIW
jgi:hypothetical protein